MTATLLAGIFIGMSATLAVDRALDGRWWFAGAYSVSFIWAVGLAVNAPS